MQTEGGIISQDVGSSPVVAKIIFLFGALNRVTLSFLKVLTRHVEASDMMVGALSRDN